MNYNHNEGEGGDLSSVSNESCLDVMMGVFQNRWHFLRTLKDKGEDLGLSGELKVPHTL